MSVKVVLWFLALLSLCGNAYVIFSGVRAFKNSFASMSNVEKVHNILIFNLAIADFLMGVYLLSLNILYSRKKYHIFDPTCTSIAILNFISSQVSVTTLAIITSCRLYSAIWPYRTVSVHRTVVCVGITWLVWSIVAVLPLVVALESNHVYVNDMQCDTLTEIKITSSNNMFDPLNSTLVHLENFTVCSLRVGYYNHVPVCSMRFFFQNPSEAGFIFSMCIVSFNVLTFVYMLGAYLFVCRSTTHGDAIWCSVGALRKCICGLEQGSLREVENRRMQRLIFFIVLTDFLCWIPVSLTALVVSVVLPYSDAYTKWLRTVNSLSNFTVIMLTVNSAVNPLLFSTSLRRKCCNCHENRHSLSVEITETPSNGREIHTM